MQNICILSLLFYSANLYNSENIIRESIKNVSSTRSFVKSLCKSFISFGQHREIIMNDKAQQHNLLNSFVNHSYLSGNIVNTSSICGSKSVSNSFFQIVFHHGVFKPYTVKTDLDLLVASVLRLVFAERRSNITLMKGDNP